uniref:Uncharacterized protein n=1 Tax=Haptolina brevifila TaxID=156173 RepID=A0A7S2NC10_9EUKA|mmetsp:Transcript_72651/g.144323  ORF Transcript_72651/g.144323 Transcript_72651/m.144323 type:complete len:454 (+) Transcript_72651:57-1418(+)
MPLAAFKSNSSRFSGPRGAMQGPVPRDYMQNYFDMGPAAARAGASRRGSFGGSASREMPWHKSSTEAPGAATSASNEAPVPSSFNSSSHLSVPSAAFKGSGDRFYKSNQSTPGPGSYSARTPLSPSNRMNRSSSFGSKTRRFAMKQQDGPGPGEFEAKPSAFASASQQRSRPGSSGFGSRSARASPFDVSRKEDTAPAPGAYDTAASGAFTARGTNGRSASPSGAFRSGSSRFGRTYDKGQSGADPGAYDPSEYQSMARNAGRSFNKASSNGASGFGTSLRRQEVVKVTEGPGPAAYNSEGATARGGSPRRGGGASSAFASRTKGGEAHIRKSEGPNGASDFDPHAMTGMAASSRKSFNAFSSSGRGLGPRAEREVVRQPRMGSMPGPGAYGVTGPSCERQAISSRAKPSLWASSTSGRDPTTWHERAKPPETPGPGSYNNDDPTRPTAYVKE